MSTITAQALAEAVTSDADGEVQWWTRQGSSEHSLTREGRRLVITDTEEGVTLTYCCLLYTSDAADDCSIV